MSKNVDHFTDRSSHIKCLTLFNALSSLLACIDNILNVFCFRLISISMGLSACNAAGHLASHSEVAPNHAGITFAVSNTLVSTPLSHVLAFIIFIYHPYL